VNKVIIAWILAVISFGSGSSTFARGISGGLKLSEIKTRVEKILADRKITYVSSSLDIKNGHLTGLAPIYPTIATFQGSAKLSFISLHNDVRIQNNCTIGLPSVYNLSSLTIYDCEGKVLSANIEGSY
jgi:hypothetical protein